MSVILAKGTSGTTPLPLFVDVLLGDSETSLLAFHAKVFVEFVLELVQTRPWATKHKVYILHVVCSLCAIFSRSPKQLGLGQITPQDCGFGREVVVATHPAADHGNRWNFLQQ